MNIYVDGKPAALKKGFSFDYTAENRLFLGRDGYTLNITFPLRDCSQNVEIFGYIHRSEVPLRKTNFDCIIQDGEVSLHGLLCVTKISDVEVECQFAEGRCAQVAADPFEDVYVNELDLGAPEIIDPSQITPDKAWKNITFGAEAVALPWVNEASPTAPNNWVNRDASGNYIWDNDTRGLSWQPYLIILAKRICEAVGYSYDFSEWESSSYRFLIVCNSLPASWNAPGYSRALPAWTVTEFFEKLELFMMCEFEFDHIEHSVRMRFSESALAAVAPVQIEQVVDSYDVAVSQDAGSGCDYIAAKRLAYKECSHSMWPYYSCDWFLQRQPDIRSYNTLSELLSKNKCRVSYHDGYTSWEWGENWSEQDIWGRKMQHNAVGSVLYAADVDTYFVFRSIGAVDLGKTPAGRRVYGQKYVLQPINVFGSGVPENDSVPSEDIEFVPPCVMDTFISFDDDRGPMMFLSPGSFAEAEDTVRSEPDEIKQPRMAELLERGDKDNGAAYYDVVFVAYWDGQWQPGAKSPHPIIDTVAVEQDWSMYRTSKYSMRLAGSSSPICPLPQIDPRRKYKFSWLGRNIPNPRAIFFIHGRRYLCEKITATFTENGMSQLLKGEFYPLADD